MCLFNLIWWSKAEWEDKVSSMGDMIRNPENIEITRRVKGNRG